MTAKDIFNGSTGNRATILILDDLGLPKTGVAWDATSLVISYRIDTGSEVDITLSSGNWFEVGGGKYVVDVPDSVYLAANLGKYVQFYGSLTDCAVYGEQHRVVANDPLAAIPESVAKYDQRNEDTTPGTIGWYFKKLRQANLTVEAVVTNDITPTPNTFSVNLTVYPTGAFRHAVMTVVEDSVILEQNSPIESFTNNTTYSTIVLEESLTGTPQPGDIIVIGANTHVHSIQAIANGVWGTLAAGYSAASTTFGGILYSIGTMIEYVENWQWKSASLTNFKNMLYDLFQRNPAFITERSVDDDKALTFGWPNSTDTINAEVSIDNGPYTPVNGTISYLRPEGDKHYFILSFNSLDRPQEEGTARYKFYSNSHTMYATLRVVQPTSVGFGPYKLICNTTHNGIGVPGVIVSIVGTYAQAVSNQDGESDINVDGNKTYSVRFSVPGGYKSIDDIIINVAEEDYTLNVELEKYIAPVVEEGLCVLQLFIRSQGTIDVEPIVGAEITAKLPDCFTVSGDVIHLNTFESAITDENGYAELVLLQGQSYMLEITSASSYDPHRIEINIPNEASTTLSHVIE